MKKKGFTLVELLAVIVILSVVAIITIVVIGNVIEQAKIKKYYSEEKAMEHAAELYLVKNQNALESGVSSQEITLQTLINSKNMKPVHDTGNGGLCNGEESKVLVTVDTNNKKNIKFKGCLSCSNYKTKGEDCGYEDEDETEEVVQDQKPYCLETETKSGKTYYYIDSVEDLYAFSDSVNSGTNYYNSVVLLRNNLDMSKTISSTQEKCDGTKVTVNKFNPIGTSSYKFDGTFEGNAKTISNLTINDNTLDYVGLFGYINSQGIIRELNLKNTTITGHDNVGALLGFNEGSVRGITLTSSTVTGNNMVGGVIGRSQGTTYEIISSGNVTANEKVGGIIGYSDSNNNSPRNLSLLSNTNVTGNETVGGLIGYAGGSYSYGDNYISGVIESGTITGKKNISKIANTGSYTTITTLSSSDVVKNKTTNDSNTYSSNDGTSFDSSYKGRLNGYDGYLDTYIGGDDNTGFYFDYNNKNKIVVKSKDRNPIPIASDYFKKGDGSSSNPYEISSVADYKVAVANLNYYYKITSDIDFNNKEIYMLGTELNNYAKGINGDGHTLKNIKINGINYTGLIGYNRGTIESLNLSNIKVDGYDYIGSTAGYNNGTVKGMILSSSSVTGNNKVGGVIGHSQGNTFEINISGNVTGNNYVGGVIGYSDHKDGNGYAPRNMSLLSNTNVTGNETVAGLIGYTGGSYTYGNSIINGVIESGTVTAKKNVSKIANTGSYTTITTLSSSDVVKNKTTNDSNTYSGNDGTSFDSSYKGRLNGYDGYLDTYIGGDSDGSGYYYDYNNNNIVIKSTSKNPIPLASNHFANGDGSSSNPYKIGSVADYKVAVANLNYYYNLSSDIDFNNEEVYMLGSKETRKNYKLDGQGYTIKNIKIKGIYYTGFTGYNTFDIENINFKNSNIDGLDYVGTVTGEVSRSILGVNVISTNL